MSYRELETVAAERLRAIVAHAETLMNDEIEVRDRKYILEDMIHRVDIVTDWVDRERPEPVDQDHRYAYPMEGEQ